jgi:hypothetical protein
VRLAEAQSLLDEGEPHIGDEGRWRQVRLRLEAAAERRPAHAEGLGQLAHPEAWLRQVPGDGLADRSSGAESSGSSVLTDASPSVRWVRRRRRSRWPRRKGSMSPIGLERERNGGRPETKRGEFFRNVIDND